MSKYAQFKDDTIVTTQWKQLIATTHRENSVFIDNQHV